MQKKDWKWIKTIGSNLEPVSPVKAGAFIISLDYQLNKFSAKTDCNRFFGSFSIVGTRISFNHIGSTRMYCKDSQERVFIDQLAKSTSFDLNEADNSLELKAVDGSKMTLEAL